MWPRVPPEVLIFDEPLIDEAARLISTSERIVAFSGAGMSEESGIPTFRDPGGLWDRYDPGDIGIGDIFSGLASGAASPETAIQFISEFLSCFEGARPNPGHSALVELEAMGILRTVITQNIDNLHREAGNTSVIEVHGNVCRLSCFSCGGGVTLERGELLAMGWGLVELLGRMDLEGVMKLVSKCPCGGACRPDVVAFGEPVQDLYLAHLEAGNADLMLVLGTSGVVYPAAAIPSEAKMAGARLIEINASGSCFPGISDLVITGRTGEVLPVIIERVRVLRDLPGR